MRIIMDSVRDHLVPIISNEDTAKKMYEALRNLFENENLSRIIALKDQLRQCKFKRDDSISTFFVKLSQIRDQLTAIGETIPDRDGTDCYGWSPFQLGSVCKRSMCPWQATLFWWILGWMHPRRNEGECHPTKGKGRRDSSCLQIWKEEERKSKQR